MSFVTALLKAYEAAEKQQLVDNYDENKTMLLPLYHSNMKSKNKNIICISMNIEGEYQKAEFLPDNQIIIFPVTEQSVSRSGSNPPPHPLSDKLQYIIPDSSDKHQHYLKEFYHFYEASKSDKSRKFLRSVHQLLKEEYLMHKIAHDLFIGKETEVKGTTVYYQDEKGKSAELDLASIFVTFAVIDFDRHQTATVSNLKDLHDDYIQYADTKLPLNGICNISGKEDYITQKHRGLLGNAKLISVSNNTETYIGRFREKTDIVRIGYRTSEKVHLMLKYLLENENSHKWLSDQQYLVNWFSDDISNDRNINIVQQSGLLARLNANLNRSTHPAVTERNRQIGQAFVHGSKKLENHENYYVGIIDKASNGRISLKYFKELSISQLMMNLEKWQSENSWWRFKKESGDAVLQTPDIYNLIDTTFGIEREGSMVLDNSNFRKMQIRNLVTCIVEGRSLSANYIHSADLNCRNRLKYSKSWQNLLFVSLSILNKQKEEFKEMVDRDKNNRSYLFGRLLAVYERIEASTFDIDTKRTTNAEKLWTSYTNNPATMMQTLENKTKTYEKKLEQNKPGIYNNLIKEKQAIINQLHENQYEEMNTKLDYEFIFGYYAEIKDIFTKKQTVEGTVNAE